MAQTDQEKRAAAHITQRAGSKSAAQKELERQEEKQEVGLAPRSTKTKALDLSGYSAIFPGRKARYVHLDKVDTREAEGWQRVLEADMSKVPGNKKVTLGTQYVAMWHTEAYVRAHHRAVDQRTRSLLEATRGQFKAEVAQEERRLRDEGVLRSDQSLLSGESD
jgi:hypothetical protein